MTLFIKKLIRIIVLIATVHHAAGQPKILDRIIGIVGDKKVMQSELEEQYYNMLAQGMKDYPGLRCEVFEDLLSQKLLLNQAEIDSIMVTEPQVDLQLEQRMGFFVNQIGSEEKLTEYFNKSIVEIKEDLRDAIRDQLVTDKMRAEITGDINATPSEVRNFYESLPKDSIPYVNAEVELNQIVLYPPSSEEAVFEVRERLLDLRQRILEGENFATLAVLYSEGPSAPRGGDIGWSDKASLDPEYAKVAFSLKKGQVSKIVESSFGFHIIELLDRTGERVHTRHILMKPKITPEAKEEVMARLDSIVRLIRLDSLTFERAAMYFSEDPETRLNGGQVVNPNTGGTKFELDQFETEEYNIIHELEVGEISRVYEYQDKKGKTVYKVIRLKKKTVPHVANLKDDYSLLKMMAASDKQRRVVDSWIRERLKSTYVKINPDFRDCNFRISGWFK